MNDEQRESLRSRIDAHLKGLSEQQLFDNALNGVKAQGAYGSFYDGVLGETRIVYRTPSGCRCNIGHNLPDETLRKVEA